MADPLRDVDRREYVALLAGDSRDTKRCGESKNSDAWRHVV
jgi:hypothetical protein